MVLAGASGILRSLESQAGDSAIESKQKRLQAANDQLEAKVRERTAELAESNTSLKAKSRSASAPNWRSSGFTVN